MVKTLCWGGLGDAAMVYAKLANSPITLEDLAHTHVEMHDKLLPAIREFYQSQKICYDVFKISGQEEFDRINKNYDFIMETSWQGFPWDIKPFVKFNTTEKYKYDIVINISAGRNENRMFINRDVIKFINEHKEKHNIVLVGQHGMDYAFDHLGITNLLNKTSIQSLIDILVSTPVFIGHPGFCCYVSAMSGNTVYSTTEHNWQKRFHPEWNCTFIKNILEVL